MPQKAPLPIQMMLPVIGAVVCSNAEHVPTKLTFDFSKFPKSKRKNHHFYAIMAQKVPLPVWLMLPMIDAAVCSNTEHAPTKPTFDFQNLHSPDEKKQFFDTSTPTSGPDTWRSAMIQPKCV